MRAELWVTGPGARSTRVMLAHQVTPRHFSSQVLE